MDVPFVVFTVTLTAPADSAGVVTVRDVADAAVTVAAVEPKSTVSPEAVALNPVPAIVTLVPPAVVPLVGLIDVITGAGGGGVTYVYVAAFDVPPDVVTVTLTAPAAPAGAVTVSDVVDAAVTVAAVEPKSTVSPDAVALNPVPVIVTVVPPAVVPLVGLIDVIAGTGGGATYV